MSRKTTLGISLSGMLAAVVLAAGAVSAQTAPTLMWARQTGSTAADYGLAVTVDSTGDVYITGTAYGDVGGQTNAGGGDVFLTKFSGNGQYGWTSLLGTVADEQGYGVATDGAGGIYVCGGTYGNLAGQTNAGLKDGFLARFDRQGANQWTRLLGTGADETAYGIAVGGGGVYVAGSTGGNLNGQTSTGGTDAFVARYDTAGNVQWTTLVGSTAYDAANAIASDAAGNLRITGQTFGAPGGQTSVGGGDAFVARLDSAGAVQWTRVLGTKLYESGNAVAVDASGNALVAGYTEGKLDGQATVNSAQAFLSKYDASGTLLWTKLLGAPTYAAGYGISLDAAGNAYLVGHTRDDFGGQTNLGGDAFVAKYDANGNLAWVRLLGSDGYDTGRGIFVDAAGSIHLAGWTDGSLAGQTNAGDFDALLAQLAVVIPGDANRDGVVDLQDFSVLKESFGQSGMEWAQGDFNGDGVVDLQDFSLLKDNFGAEAPPLSVPEPLTAAGLALASLALSRRPRR